MFIWNLSVLHHMYIPRLKMFFSFYLVHLNCQRRSSVIIIGTERLLQHLLNEANLVTHYLTGIWGKRWNAQVDKKELPLHIVLFIFNHIYIYIFMNMSEWFKLHSQIKQRKFNNVGKWIRSKFDVTTITHRGHALYHSRSIIKIQSIDSFQQSTMSRYILNFDSIHEMQVMIE